MRPMADRTTDTTERAEPPSERTRVRRLPERGAYDRETIDAILDEALICHVGFVADGEPRGHPDDPRACRRHALRPRLDREPDAPRRQGGAPVCVTVTLLDGLVLARSAFHHSMNYRSVVVLGRAREVTDPGREARGAARRSSSTSSRGRADDVRAAEPAELAQTTVLAMPIEEASAKVRTGPPNDEEEDMDLPVWAGVVPDPNDPGRARARPPPPGRRRSARLRHRLPAITGRRTAPVR